MSPCLNDNFCSWSIPKNRNLTDPEFHRPQRSQRLKEYYNHLTYYPCFHRLLDRFYLFKSMVGFQWPSRHPILVPMNHRVPMPITTYTRICIVTTQFCNIGGGNEQGSDPLLSPSLRIFQLNVSMNIIHFMLLAQTWTTFLQALGAHWGFCKILLLCFDLVHSQVDTFKAH